MRRVAIQSLAVALLLTAPQMRQMQAAPQMPQQQFILNDDIEFENGRYNRGDPTPQLVRNILQLQRENGMDNWAWRDSVENQLVSLGPSVISALKQELPQHDGYAADAIEVALFRLQNSPLIPGEALQQWGEKHFGVSISAEHPNVNPLKISRVMDSPNGAGMSDVFPHHLFYVVECKKIRLVVALAADAKVQPLPDDASLVHFIQTEATPQLSVNDKARLASAAALLMLARVVTPYNPEFRQQNLDTDLHTYKYTLQFESFRQTATLTFTPASELATLSSGQAKPNIDVKPAAPINAPTTTAAPPLMPE